MRISWAVLLPGLLLVAAVCRPAPAQSPGSEMDYGPALCHTITFRLPADPNAPGWPGAVTRTMNADLPGDAVLCYDMDRLAVAGWWRGPLIDASRTHLTSYKGGLPPRPGAKPAYENLESPGWKADSDALQLIGYHQHDRQVVLEYHVDGRQVLELPTAAGPCFCRTLAIGPGEQTLRWLPFHLPGATVALGDDLSAVASGDLPLVAMLQGDTEKLAWKFADDQLELVIPPSQETRLLSLWFREGDDLPGLEETAQANPPQDPAKLLAGGPRRWTDVVTQGTRAKDDAAYVVDDLRVPENPFGSWMRLTGIAAFPDGRLIATTLSGDVWIVSWPHTTAGDDLSQITWRRFAVGLYEPLGVQIVDGLIYVRGRDRITRLHDRNQDGEADFYENFHSAGQIGPSYHAFLFDLVTDAEGNFYFARSGRKAPSPGEVVKVSPDGKQREIVATQMRHANGLGAGGPHNWVLVADNPDGKFPSGASIVRPGKRYGFNGPRTEPMLYILPPKVDTSSGSQCWTDAKRWGPLGGVIAHTSFSTSQMTYVMVQDSKPHPSGFAVQFPFPFKSGVMRLCVSPLDGQLYVAGQRGWDTNAAIDGAISRIRYTGKKAYVVTGAAAVKAGVELKFSCPLDPESVDYDNFYAERIGAGVKEIEIDDVELLDDHTVLVRIPDLDPAAILDKRSTRNGGEQEYLVLDPLAIEFRIKAKDGVEIKETVYATINGN
ncbi:DUF6797 domain-containing protein [Lignipirellula cremea]|uniref:DUF6797 domain-containing protein n=1 Tax=Lignipirellula cremea TaxID=2528010 RepID=A0A518DZ99_9BACT|nr:DUF6797 domain-containing protein [Lignipirellula cremea]QDU97164.1 hypothetical protein Pla8534_50090 [Lignipirellula cremea]